MNQLQAEYIRITQQLEDAARKIDLYQKQYDLSLAILPTDRPGILDRKNDLDRRDPSGATNVGLSLEEKRSDSGI